MKKYVKNMKKYPPSIYRLWYLEERSTELSELRVVVYIALSLYIDPGTWKNSEPSPSMLGASRQNMKHDLYFLV